MSETDFDAIMGKLLSRKFLLSLAAFIAAFCGGAGGFIDPGLCAILMAVSAGIYAACEALVDGAAAGANGTTQVYAENVSKSVTATSADKATVVAAFKAGGDE